MANITMISGGEDPLSRDEQREWDRIQFETIVAPYIGDALFSPTRIMAERELIEIGIYLPPENEQLAS